MFSKMQNFAAFFRFAFLNEQNILFEGQKLPHPKSFKILSQPHFLIDFDEILTVIPSDDLLDMHKAALSRNQNCGEHRCKCPSEANFRDFFLSHRFLPLIACQCHKNEKTKSPRPLNVRGGMLNKIPFHLPQ